MEAMSTSAIPGNISFYNDSLPVDDSLPISKGVVYFFAIALPVIAITGLIGNVLFMVVFKTVRSMRTTTNYYLLSLSIADSLFLAACVPLEVMSFLVAVRGDDSFVTCVLWTFFNMVPLFTSIFTIGLISLERYIAICHPFKAQRPGRAKQILGLIISSWVLALILATFYLVGCFHLTVTLYVTFAICQIVPFLISLVVVIALYIPVMRRLKRQNLATVSIRALQNGSRHSRDRHQIVRLLIITTVVFFICVFPDCFLTFQVVLGVLGQPVPIPWDVFYDMFFFCRLLLYLNSAVNPIIYNATSSKYRQAFRQAFSRCCCWSKQVTRDSSVKSTNKFSRSGRQKKRQSETNYDNNSIFIIAASSLQQLHVTTLFTEIYENNEVVK
ncbi:thyrotropin-releasing hormone receptor-like [Ptychodera flava]|uniref:thyrotropin-releasing hormone receptor-like n=1 Tax=Ptychodera flava TaxID=63121 RepID=UPI003969C370